MSNYKSILYYIMLDGYIQGYVSNYIDNGDGTFKCSVQRIDWGKNLVTTEETLFGIKNIYGFVSPNLPTQYLLMSSDNNIFIPMRHNEVSFSEYLNRIYIKLYITKKYGVIKDYSISAFLGLLGIKNNDSTYDSIPEDTDENKLKKTIYRSYLYALDIRNNGTPEDLKKDESYWKNTSNINKTLYSFFDSKIPNFCVKINSTKNPINENLKYFDCSSSSNASPDIIVLPDIESAAEFLKKNMTYLVLGTIGVVVLIAICCSVTFMFMKKKR